MDRSLPFYLDQLGFRLLSDTQESIGRWVAVAPPDGTAILVLVQPKPESDEYRLIGHSRYVIFVTEDVPAKFVKWSQRGVRFRDPPKAEAWGGVVTGFEDMDGNSYVLVGYDAASREIEVQRRSAQEMEIAKQVQARMFPQTLPSVDTLDYAGICLQAPQLAEITTTSLR